MHTTLTPPQKAAIVYPERDGKPMADNTKQYQWIRKIEGNLSAMYEADPQVFIAGDLFWYPAEGFPEIVSAPDVMIVFGRPRKDRRSYKQWEENDIGPQVVFEILSHNNDYLEMEAKFDLYEDHGVEEYYVYDPERNTLRISLRDGPNLLRQRKVDGFISPLLKIRFDFSGPEMVIRYPDGRPFLSFVELAAERRREQQLRLDAEQRADDATKLADDATKQAESAQQRADDVTKQAETAQQRANRLAQLSVKLLAGQASDEEKQELAQLAAAPAP